MDAYWDAQRSIWSLCPAEMPPSNPDERATATASETASSDPSPIGGAARAVRGEGSPGVVEPRQDASSESSNAGVTSSASTTVEPSAASSTVASEIPPTDFPSFLSEGDAVVLEIGKYNCTSTIALGFLTGIFEDFLDATSTTTDATFTFLLLNIHAASSWTAPNDPAPQPSSDKLPGPGNLISDIMKGNLTDELYTPELLRKERANLNNTWLDVVDVNLPAEGYYQREKDARGFLTTPNGWPTEAYMEFKELYRLITSFGRIDPQMSGYDLSAELDAIFPPDTIRDEPNVVFASDGSITSGCLFDSSKESITADTNSSWAIGLTPYINVRANPNLTVPIPAVADLISCGLSPLLNTTLANVTADQNPLPYAAYAHSYLWSWAPGQPRNATSTSEGSTENRCAVIHASGAYPGRWQTVDCNEHHRVACQDLSTPYTWAVSSSSPNYFDGDKACDKPLAFSVPHTALENTHLLAAIHAAPSNDDDAIFINLNDLDVPDCWVETVNGTCPYIPPTDTSRTRVVVVPTVAAVIIFVLAALTFFVKCAANRREDKRGRRRRMNGGWEYEGVPS